jgi:ATP-dependent Clp protease ATP-binding subunit ClpC
MIAERAGGVGVAISLSMDGPSAVMASADAAVDDLALWADDSLSRAHPGHVASLLYPAEGALVELEVPVLPVWRETQRTLAPLSLSVVFSSASSGFVDAFAPRAGLRFWLPPGEDVYERAAALFEADLARWSDDDLLALRKTGREEIATRNLRPKLRSLSSLRYAVLLGHSAIEDDEDGADPFDDPKTRAVADAYDRDAGIRRRAASARVPDRKATETLRRVGEPWHELAREGRLPRAHGRDALVASLTRRVRARTPEPIVLVGPSGAGKTALCAELAHRLDDPSERGRDGEDDRGPTTLFALDASRLIASAGGFGAWQQQLLSVLSEAAATNAVLHLGAAVDLLDAGRSADGDENVAQSLLPVLATRQVRVLAEATIEQWTEIERRNPALARAFSVLRVDEPSANDLRAIAGRVADELSRAHAVSLTPGAIDACIELARRFWPYGSLTGGALSFLRRAVEARAHGRAVTLGATEVIDAFSAESGIPPVLLRDDLSLDPAEVRAALHARVVGQHPAVERVVEAISVLKAGLQDRKKPSAVLLFIGPTGVGKTELARALSRFVFGSDERMVRLDMGEYAGPDALARLVGDAQGPGSLCAAVRRQPFSVVLLDEVEKAHPAVFDALLGVLGEGRLSDAAGRLTDFRNCVLVMTSNLGADTARPPVGFDAGGAGAAIASARAHYKAATEAFFRPELLNRIDDLVPFDPLSREAVREVVRRELARLGQREGLRRSWVTLAPSDALVDALARDGFDPRYGARPLKRVIERRVTAPLAAQLAQWSQSVEGGARAGALLAHARGARIDAQLDAGGSVVFRLTHGPGSSAVGLERAEQAVTLAGALRATVQRWSRTRLVASLRTVVATFDQAVRVPGFWADTARAERASRRAIAARGVLATLDDAMAQACATEDLAFEAFFSRNAEDIAGLAEVFSELGQRVERAVYELFLSLSPPVNERPLTVLHLQTRDDIRWLQWLRDAYLARAAALGVSVEVFVPRHEGPAARAPSRGGRGRAQPAAEGAISHWEVLTADSPDWDKLTFLTLVLRGERGRCFLAEHGVHRIQLGGSASGVGIVVCRASCEHGDRPPLEPIEEGFEEGFFPEFEARRLRENRRTATDARTGLEVTWNVGGLLDLKALHESWIHHEILTSEEAFGLE